MVNSDYNKIYSELKEQFGRFEAGEILFHTTGVAVNQLAFVGEETIQQQQLKEILDVCSKRSSGVPLQYIIGMWEFYSLPFYVGEGVLIPRADTETLVDVALEILEEKPNANVLDLCAGTGCVGISISKNSNASVACVELSDIAYSYLIKNVEHNKSLVSAIKADVLTYNPSEKFDLIVSNPPYITKADMLNLQLEVKYEPEMALDGGIDGLDFYRKIIKRYYEKLKDGGYLCFEIGINQAEDLKNLFELNGYKNIESRKDLAGITRVVWARK